MKTRIRRVNQKTFWTRKLSRQSRTLRDWWLRCCICLLGALLLTGCKEQATVQASPFQGATVRVVVPQGWKLPEAWEVQLDEWSARTGANASCVESDSAKLGVTEGELILLPWSEWGRLQTESRWRAWPKSTLGEDQLAANDLFRGLREKIATSGPALTLVPVNCPVLVLYYRSDLLEQAGLAPPQTWEEYQKLLDTLPTWAPGLTAVEPWGPEFRATMFLARMTAYAQHPGHFSLFFEIETGEPLLDQPGFQRGWQRTQQALAKLDPACRQWHPVQCRDAILQGQAALAIGLEPWRGLQRNPLGDEAPQPADKRSEPLARATGVRIGCIRLPGAAEAYNPTIKAWEAPPDDLPNHVTLTGFSGFCAVIPKAASEVTATAAANLWQTLSLDEMAAAPPGLFGLCREQHSGDAPAFAGSELSATEAAQYLSAVSKSLRSEQIVLELPCLGRDDFRNALTEGLTSALEDESKVEGLLPKLTTEWQAILKKHGQAAVRDSYRRSLGLRTAGEETQPIKEL